MRLTNVNYDVMYQIITNIRLEIMEITGSEKGKCPMTQQRPKGRRAMMRKISKQKGFIQKGNLERTSKYSNSYS